MRRQSSYRFRHSFPAALFFKRSVCQWGNFTLVSKSCSGSKSLEYSIGSLLSFSIIFSYFFFMNILSVYLLLPRISENSGGHENFLGLRKILNIKLIIDSIVALAIPSVSQSANSKKTVIGGVAMPEVQNISPPNRLKKN